MTLGGMLHRLRGDGRRWVAGHNYPESDGYDEWCLELRREGRDGEEDESGWDLLKSSLLSLE